MAEPKETEERVVFSDPDVIRALAHPARVAVLDYLGDRDDGATATECAEVAGMSPSAMSYHLRALAKVGLLEQAPGRGDGRERVWRRKVKSYSIGPEYEASESVHMAGRIMSEAFQSISDAKLHRWLDRMIKGPKEWYEATYLSQSSLHMTAKEAHKFMDDVNALLEPFVQRRRSGEMPEGARAVAFHTRLFPED